MLVISVLLDLKRIIFFFGGGLLILVNRVVLTECFNGTGVALLQPGRSGWLVFVQQRHHLQPRVARLPVVVRRRLCRRRRPIPRCQQGPLHRPRVGHGQLKFLSIDPFGCQYTFGWGFINWFPSFSIPVYNLFGCTRLKSCKMMIFLHQYWRCSWSTSNMHYRLRH